MIEKKDREFYTKKDEIYNREPDIYCINPHFLLLFSYYCCISINSSLQQCTKQPLLHSGRLYRDATIYQIQYRVAGQLHGLILRIQNGKRLSNIYFRYSALIDPSCGVQLFLQTFLFAVYLYNNMGKNKFIFTFSCGILIHVKHNWVRKG